MIKKTVTFCIPAFNEYSNLIRLLVELRKQNSKYYILSKIIILSDNSTDETNASDIFQKSKNVELIVGKKQLGKPKRVNQMLKICKSQIAIIMDADIKFAHSSVIDELVYPIVKGDADFTSGVTIPKNPTNVVSKIANSGVKIWRKAMTYLPNPNLYQSEGMLRAFSRSIYAKLIFPDAAQIEDTYPYLYAAKHDYRFVAATNAKVLYQLPTTLHDYVSQQRRYLSTNNLEENYFSSDFVSKNRPMKSAYRFYALLNIISLDPLYTVGYLFCAVYIRITLIFKPMHSANTWEILESTKVV